MPCLGARLSRILVLFLTLLFEICRFECVSWAFLTVCNDLSRRLVGFVQAIVLDWTEVPRFGSRDRYQILLLLFEYVHNCRVGCFSHRFLYILLFQHWGSSGPYWPLLVFWAMVMPSFFLPLLVPVSFPLYLCFLFTNYSVVGFTSNSYILHISRNPGQVKNELSAYFWARLEKNLMHKEIRSISRVYYTASSCCILLLSEVFDLSGFGNQCRKCRNGTAWRNSNLSTKLCGVYSIQPSNQNSVIKWGLRYCTTYLTPPYN